MEVETLQAPAVEIRELFKAFLHGFNAQLNAEDTEEDQMNESHVPKYVDYIENDMKKTESTTMLVDFVDVRVFNADLATEIETRFYRVEGSLRKGLQDFVREVDPSYVKSDEQYDKEFYVSFFNLAITEHLRDLKVEKIGQLKSFCGTITRTSEVRPELFLGAFKCLECNTIVSGIEQHFKYSPPVLCTNQTCGNRKNWSLVREDSVFVDWQRLKVQENADEVPAGSLPRSIDVILRNSLVDTAKAGDKSIFTGCLVVVPDVSVMAGPGERVTVSGSSRGSASTSEGVTGLQSLGVRELTYKLMFIANCVQATQNNAQTNIRTDDDFTPDQVLDLLEHEEGEQRRLEVEEMANDSQVYAKMAASICPSVYGHTSIKQALLLMLFGGIHKSTPEGISLRGDINIAIVGDPSCAKSQLLKYIASFLPRAIYTSGKASTAAGLTASVVKEPENNEFAIEAGALMLADNGICCIDEFDKMDVKDQVAIHEAMEQQTISIAKAGIQATLNARTSILAAANPVRGRYDKSKPLKYNVALPPAILSRFDLLHVMVDDTSEETDLRIASHILAVHRLRSNAVQVPYTTEQMQRYIRYCRAIKPILTPEAQATLVNAYKELRSEDAAPGTQSAYRITVRQLEALVRLSEATARVFASPEIKPVHVQEAKRLIRASILKIEQTDVELEEAPFFERPAAVAAADFMDYDDEAAANENDPAAANVNQDNGGDEGRAAKRVRTTTEEPQAADPSTAVPAPPAEQPAQVQRVSAAKFNLVKTFLLKHLREVALGSEEEQMGGSESEGGVKQRDLIAWYLEEQTIRGTITSTSEAESELMLVGRIINRLRKDGVLSVAYRPERTPGEAPEEYAVRAAEERVLTISANYVID